DVRISGRVLLPIGRLLPALGRGGEGSTAVRLHEPGRVLRLRTDWLVVDQMVPNGLGAVLRGGKRYRRVRVRQRPTAVRGLRADRDPGGLNERGRGKPRRPVRLEDIEAVGGILAQHRLGALGELGFVSSEVLAVN